MMLLVPSSAPPGLIRAVAGSPVPALLLRGDRPPPAELLGRIPLAIDPSLVASGGGRDDRAVVAEDYRWIEWAKGRGFRAIWYSPEFELPPTLHPLHDREIRRSEELGRPPEFSHPDIEECLSILRAHGVPDNVRRHSAVVAAVAYFLALRLASAGVELDPILVHRGGLLHDLDKISTLNSDIPHGEEAAAWLRELGYPELAEIARRHILRPGIAPRTWEEKVVFLADKLVEQERLVGLSARLSALKERYPQFHREIDASEPFIRGLAGEIFGRCGLGEEDILARFRGAEDRLFAILD